MPDPKPSQTTVGTTEVQVLKVSLHRTSIILYNTHDTAIVYWLASSGVTSTNGFPLKPNSAIILRTPEDDPRHEVWMISDTASTTVGVYEGFGAEVTLPEDTYDQRPDPPFRTHPLRIGRYAKT